MTQSAALRIRPGSGAFGRARAWEAGSTTGRWQDKRAHIVLRSVGCFCWHFWRFPHRVTLGGNVRRTRKPLQFQGLSHIVGPRYGR